MVDFLTWLEAHRGAGTWFSGFVTAGALTWTLVLAGANARRANARAAANLLAADDALATMQDYLETLTHGRSAFDDTFDAQDSWLSRAPFERFRMDMREVDIAGLPSQWCRRALRRARAVVEETGMAVDIALDPKAGKDIRSADLIEVIAEIKRCRQAISPDLPAPGPRSWLRAYGDRLTRARPTRLGTLD